MPSPRSDEVAPRRVLVVEPDAEGHSQEWLQHLIEFIVADPSGPAISIAAPAALCQALARSLPQGAAERVQLIALTPRETRLCTTRPLSVAAFARWWTMRRYLDQSGADSGFFLSLDLLALPLALGLGANGKKLSGILFRPSVHYRAFGSHNPSHGEKLRDLRKELFYRLMLRNPALSRVLSLDPFFATYAVRRYAHGHKVQALPDPTHPAVAAAASDDHRLFPPGRIGFLLFGYLAERKGPLVVLEALELLPPAIAAKVAVLLAGRVDPAIRDRVEAGCRRLAGVHPDLRLRLEDRRLDQSELEALVLRSDVVLAPYQRFVGSSGVLLWAARAERPVLAQDYGLVGRLTREHRLGLAVDSSNPAALAAAIEQMVERGPQTFVDRSSARAFAASQTPDRFAAAVLADCMAKSAKSAARSPQAAST
jgi:glycosyltransferase involved in cell wall biosynthesis